MVRCDVRKSMHSVITRQDFEQGFIQTELQGVFAWQKI